MSMSKVIFLDGPLAGQVHEYTGPVAYATAPDLVSGVADHRFYNVGRVHLFRVAYSGAEPAEDDMWRWLASGLAQDADPEHFPYSCQHGRSREPCPVRRRRAGEDIGWVFARWGKAMIGFWVRFGVGWVHARHAVEEVFR